MNICKIPLPINEPCAIRSDGLHRRLEKQNLLLVMALAVRMALTALRVDPSDPIGKVHRSIHPIL